MRNFKRAILSVGHQLRKSFLVLLLITTVLTMIMIGLSIQKAVDQASQNAKDQMKADTTIQLNMDKLMQEGQGATVPPLTREVYEKIKKIKGVTDAKIKTQAYINNELKPFYKDGKKPEDAMVMGGLPDDFKMPTNTLYGIDNKKDDDDFESGKFQLIDGKMPNESDANNPVIISNKYAELNNLKIGDTIKAGGGNNGTKNIDFTVCGIFEAKVIKETKMMDYDPMSHPNNNFYTTTKIAETVATLDDPNKPITYENIYVKIDKVDNVERVINEIKKDKSLDWSYYSFVSDFDQYERMTSAINNVASISNIILWIAGIAGVIVLSLIMMLSFRDRKFEIGVLLSIGEAKTGVILQMLTEVFIIFICSFGLATGISTASANTIGDSLVSSEVQNTKKEEDAKKQNNNNSTQIISGNFEEEERKLDAVDKINVDVTNSRVLTTSFGLGLSIVFISTLLPLILVLRKDPKSIMLDKD